MDIFVKIGLIYGIPSAILGGVIGWQISVGIILIEKLLSILMGSILFFMVTGLPFVMSPLYTSRDSTDKCSLTGKSVGENK